VSQPFNLKTGVAAKGLNTTLKPKPTMNRSSDQPLKHFRSNIREKDAGREMLSYNRDIDTVERPERSTSKTRDSLLMDDGCINIYRKDNPSGDRGRRTSSAKSKRHLSSSHSKSSPVRFGSSESRRKAGPKKVLETQVLDHQ
jgi:hypothetical protein